MDVVRLLFHYSPDGVTLIHQYHVDMIMPLNTSSNDSPGHHVVVKDDDDNEISRHGALGAFAGAEQFHSDGTISRADALPSGVFQVIIPYHQAANSVALVHVDSTESKLDPDLMRGMLSPDLVEREIRTFPLKRRYN